MPSHASVRALARRFSIALGVFALACFALALTREDEKPWTLATPAPVPSDLPTKLDELDKLSCTKCHAELVDEWASTQHALAWVDPVYREELQDKKRPETCHGCHIPEPLHEGELGLRPDPRTEDVHFGVSCDSCHLGAKGEMLGPRGTQTAAHVSKSSPTMIGTGSNPLCATCHRTNIGPVIGIAKDFESSGQEARGRSCVGCHMAEVERRWANTPPGESAASEAPLRKGRSHALQTPRDPAFLRLAFEPTLANEGGKSVLTIGNRAGHRVPGLIGRSIEFRAKLLDAQGAAIGEEQRLELDTRSYLPVDGDVKISFEREGAEVELVGLHHDPRLATPVTFLELRLKPGAR